MAGISAPAVKKIVGSVFKTGITAGIINHVLNASGARVSGAIQASTIGRLGVLGLASQQIARHTFNSMYVKRVSQGNEGDTAGAAIAGASAGIQAISISTDNIIKAIDASNKQIMAGLQVLDGTVSAAASNIQATLYTQGQKLDKLTEASDEVITQLQEINDYLDEKRYASGQSKAKGLSVPGAGGSGAAASGLAAPGPAGGGFLSDLLGELEEGAGITAGGVGLTWGWNKLRGGKSAGGLAKPSGLALNERELSTGRIRGPGGRFLPDAKVVPGGAVDEVGGLAKVGAGAEAGEELGLAAVGKGLLKSGAKGGAINIAILAAVLAAEYGIQKFQLFGKNTNGILGGFNTAVGDAPNPGLISGSPPTTLAQSAGNTMKARLGVSTPVDPLAAMSQTAVGNPQSHFGKGSNKNTGSPKVNPYSPKKKTSGGGFGSMNLGSIGSSIGSWFISPAEAAENDAAFQEGAFNGAQYRPDHDQWAARSNALADSMLATVALDPIIDTTRRDTERHARFAPGSSANHAPDFSTTFASAKADFSSSTGIQDHNNQVLLKKSLDASIKSLLSKALDPENIFGGKTVLEQQSQVPKDIKLHTKDFVVKGTNLTFDVATLKFVVAGKDITQPSTGMNITGFGADGTPTYGVGGAAPGAPPATGPSAQLAGIAGLPDTAATRPMGSSLLGTDPGAAKSKFQTSMLAPGGTGGMSKSETTDYIRKAAIARGIDPDIALRVAQSEGLNKYIGDQNTSFGPFQLHYKNNIPGLSNAGMGDSFSRQTGLDARDPSTVHQQIDYALDHAAVNGWGAWHGWKGNSRAGLDGSKPIGVSPAAPTESVRAVPTLAASPGRKPDTADVDPRLLDSVTRAATHLPAGYKVTVNEGYNPSGHVTASQHHIKGQGALDVQISDPSGKVLPNEGGDPTGMYHILARDYYGEISTKYPELKGRAAWGGAFGASGTNSSQDLMHFDIGGARGRYTANLLGGMGSRPGQTYGNEGARSQTSFPGERQALFPGREPRDHWTADDMRLRKQASAIAAGVRADGRQAMFPGREPRSIWTADDMRMTPSSVPNTSRFSDAMFAPAHDAGNKLNMFAIQDSQARTSFDQSMADLHKKMDDVRVSVAAATAPAISKNNRHAAGDQDRGESLPARRRHLKDFFNPPPGLRSATGRPW